MSTLTARDVLCFCFWGRWRRCVFGSIAVVVAWCSALVVLLVNALFPLLFVDGNLLIRGVCTLVLGAPALSLYLQGKRSLATESSSRR